MKTLNLRDLEKTSEETRNRHAGLWESDWYAVVNDMHHCTMFMMHDEFVDLLEDGLRIVGPKLTGDQSKRWQAIIEAAKRYPKGNGDLANCFAVRGWLKACSESMIALMDDICR